MANEQVSQETNITGGGNVGGTNSITRVSKVEKMAPTPLETPTEAPTVPMRRRGLHRWLTVGGLLALCVICAVCGMAVLAAVIGSAFDQGKEHIAGRSTLETIDMDSWRASLEEAREGVPEFPGLVYIPAGRYVSRATNRYVQNGTGKPKFEETRPSGWVYLSPYYLDRHEVTNAEYKAFMDATGHRAPYHWQNGEIPSGKNNHPVVQVTYADAEAYCAWAEKRLPTLWEFSKATQGPRWPPPYPWGTTWDASFTHPYRLGGTGESTHQFTYDFATGDGFEEAGHETVEISTTAKDHSPYDIYDLAGNVLEWTATWEDNSGLLSEETFGFDPLGPQSGQTRVLFGWAVDPEGSPHQLWQYPTNGSDYIGFRCARNAPPRPGELFVSGVEIEYGNTQIELYGGVLQVWIEGGFSCLPMPETDEELVSLLYVDLSDGFMVDDSSRVGVWAGRRKELPMGSEEQRCVLEHISRTLENALQTGQNDLTLQVKNRVGELLEQNR